MSNIIEEKENRERLLRNVKKECKQLMEIAVTKKFINEDNSCITSLCATIESCILHGLKRRAIGLFKTSTTMSLLQKISKNCESAKEIVNMCEDYEKAYCSNSSTINNNDSKSFNSSSTQSQSRESSSLTLFSRKIFSNTSDTSLSSLSSNQLLNGRSFSPTYYKGSNCYRLLWIRMALLNKCLIKIIDHIITCSGQFYDSYALLADPVDGPIFSSLLIGPCALEYTRMKSCEHLWNDPNADELIQRHKMHSSGNLYSSNQILSNYSPIPVSNSSMSSNNVLSNTNSKYKLGLNANIAKRKASISTVLEDISNLGGSVNCQSPDINNINNSSNCLKLTSNISNASNQVIKENFQQQAQIPLSPLGNTQNPLANISSSTSSANNTSNNSAKEYVESLHQNSKSQLIYGKNHVMVNHREKDFAGYMSLHLNPNGLVLKWTPNQIMNGSSSIEEPHTLTRTKSGYWDYAMNIDMNTIVYLHCHQQGDLGATIVLVAQDGVQHAPIRFPKGSHLLQFLTCLENGLAPNGQLDPPLWYDYGKGKIFPKLQRKSGKRYKCNVANTASDEMMNSDIGRANLSIDIADEDQEDFVFRIINSKSNVSVTTVTNEAPVKKKLEFSLSAGIADEHGSASKNSINSFLSKKFSNNPNKFSQLFSSLLITSKATTSSNESLKSSSISPKILNFSDCVNTPPPSLASPFSSYNTSFDSYTTPITPSSIVLDKGSTNGFLILSKIEIDSLSNDFSNPESSRAYKPLSVRSSLKTLCDNMRRQILSRAFYGWLAYHRHLKTVSIHLIGLINCDKDRKDEEDDENEDGDDSDLEEDVTSENVKIKIGKFYLLNKKKLDDHLWSKWIDDIGNRNKLRKNKNSFYKIVYFNGIENNLRKKIWPFLMEHYTIDMNKEERDIKDDQTLEYYSKLIEEWKPFEEYIHIKDQKKLAAYFNNNNIEKKISPEIPVVEIDKIELTDQFKKVINKPPGIKTSLFGFSLLKQKPKPLIASIDEKEPEIKKTNSPTESSPNANKSSLIRKDSSLSNEVFIENDSSFSFSLSKFSAKSLFNKLMQKNLEDLDTTSLNSTTTIVNEASEIDETEPSQKINFDLNESFCNDSIQEDNLTIEMAKQIVNNVLINANKELNKLNPISEENNTNTDDGCESTQSDSVYTDTKNVLSNTTSSLSTDEVYHDVETDENDMEVNIEKINSLIKSPSAPGDKSLNLNERKLSSSLTLVSKQVMIKKSLSNQELIESFALNMHRIDKDVTRCDRNYWYFTSTENLKKLKNIMYTYVWENINIGYIQGMCDLVAPLLVIFDDESLTYSCFKQLMKRMSSNFPHGTAMDQHFSNMRTLIQILDSDLFEHMHHRGDYTHFYFSYRWFLLDFKRELVYDDVFSVWETIWAAKYVSSAHFHLFIALALVETYRDIIIENNMDFTDIIKFFNEMAEKHNISEILELSRNLIKQLQNLIDNKNDNSI